MRLLFVALLACISACAPQSRQAQIADSFAPTLRSVSGSLSAGALAGLPQEAVVGIDDADEARIQLLGARVLEAAAIYCGRRDPLEGAGGPDCGISFALLDGSEINAFSDAELAFAIAHEVSHRLLHVGRSALGGSRKELEYEADYLGLHLAARAGFAPERATGLIRRLAARPDQGRLHPNYPTFSARLRKLTAFVPDIARASALGGALAPPTLRGRLEVTELK